MRNSTGIVAQPLIYCHQVMHAPTATFPPNLPLSCVMNHTQSTSKAHSLWPKKAQVIQASGALLPTSPLFFPPSHPKTPPLEHLHMHLVKPTATVALLLCYIKCDHVCDMCYVVSCRPGCESRELWQVLALLYKGQGRPDLSLAIYLQLQLPSVFDFIQVSGFWGGGRSHFTGLAGGVCTAGGGRVVGEGGTS